MENEEGWLLIFDNANFPEEINDFIPKTDKGNVLITSRNPDWERFAQVRHVEVMPLKESVRFLLDSTKERTKYNAEDLAKVLGNLPLAMAQAVGYIRETGITLHDYLTLFKKNQRDLLSKGKVEDHKETVSTTWEFSLRSLREKSPDSADLMNLVAFFAPDAIPIDIIKKGAKHLPEPLASAVSDNVRFNDCISALKKHSLVKRNRNFLSIHRLLQIVVRESMPEDIQKKWIEITLRILNDAFIIDDKEPKSWVSCSQLLDHIQTSIGLADKFKIKFDLLDVLLFNLASFYHKYCNFNKAKNLLNIVLEISEKKYGTNNLIYAKYLNKLGEVIFDLGDHNVALTNHEYAFEICKKAFGEEHPIIAENLMYIGYCECVLGLKKGVEKLEKALELANKYYPKDSIELTPFMHYLASGVSQFQGFEKANKLLEQSVKIYKLNYGPKHPILARSYSELGINYICLGLPVKGHKLIKQALI
ncbi:tetratricopeptide repeat protein, partial [bacterium]|nr:tetratricopeptide repeat protein [bacterium]